MTEAGVSFVDGGATEDLVLDEGRQRIIAWVGREILPHEGALRRWLRGFVPVDEIEDVVQESYCRLAALNDVAHVGTARAYFFQTARNVVLDRMRRNRIVFIDTVLEIESLEIAVDDPSPERVVAGRRELARVRRLIAALPDRCRRIIEMRKIEGLSQKEIARALGVTETIVENDVVRGQRRILKAMVEDDSAAERAVETRISDDRARAR